MFEPDQQRMNIDIVKKENTFDDDNTVFTENESTFGGSSHWNDFDDSDSSSWDSDEDDSDLDEELERIVSSSLVGKKKPKVRGKIHAANHSPAISALFTSNVMHFGKDSDQAADDRSLGSRGSMRSAPAPSRGGEFTKKPLGRTLSAPNLMPAALMVRMQAADSVGIDSMMAAANEPEEPQTKPQDVLLEIMDDKNIQPKLTPALDLVGTFFLKMSEENVKAYDIRKARAVRSGDIPALKQLHEAGELLQVCNAYRESIVHTACRRGDLDVVKFLVDVDVSLRVVDDYGRTILHDACWTATPCFDLIKFIILRFPDLLYCQDGRGHFPLEYIRKEDYDKWVPWLEENEDYLVPRELITYDF